LSDAWEPLNLILLKNNQPNFKKFVFEKRLMENYIALASKSCFGKGKAKGHLKYTLIRCKLKMKILLP